MKVANNTAFEKITIISGDVYVAESPALLTTVLGSCVAVCIWEMYQRIGGMNHYLLPSSGKHSSIADYKYGNVSIESLLRRVLLAGAIRERLTAKIFGGAGGMFGAGENIGAKNVKIAEDILKGHNINIEGMDVGGNFGRKIIFNTSNGRVLVKKLPLESLMERG